MNIIRVHRPQLTRRQFLNISRISSIGFFLLGGKWVTQVTLVSDLSLFKEYCEDQGYEWFAGL